MLRTATLALCLAFAAFQAAAQDASAPPRLKAAATVASDLVRIGDLLDNPGPLASTPLFRSPDLGQTGTIQAQRVLDALLSHGIAMIDTQGVNVVSITRSSRTVSRRDIEDAIAQSLSGQGGLGEAKNLSVTLDREVRTFYVEPSLTSNLEPTGVYYDPRSGRFDVRLELTGSAMTRQSSLRFTGAVVETQEIISLTRALNRGEQIKPGDVVTERRPKANVDRDTVADAEHAIGLATRRAMRAGEALRTADLAKPEIVTRNEAVTILFEVPGVTVSMRGKALESGAEGDLINVMNTQTKRTFQAVVIGLNRVSVSAMQAMSDDITGSVAAHRVSSRRRTE